VSELKLFIIIVKGLSLIAIIWLATYTFLWSTLSSGLNLLLHPCVFLCLGKIRQKVSLHATEVHFSYIAIGGNMAEIEIANLANW